MSSRLRRLRAAGLLVLATAIVWTAVFHFQLRDSVRAFVRLQDERIASGLDPIAIEDYMAPARRGAARTATAWAAVVLAAGSAALVSPTIIARRRRSRKAASR